MLSSLFALVILVAIFLFPVFSRELRRNWYVLSSYLFVIFLHQAVALTNSFLFTTMGAGLDAAGFHQKAVLLARSSHFSFAIGSKFYENFLGAVYWLLGPSHLLGQQLSILAFAISCIILMKIMNLLDLSRYHASVLLVFGALPTMVFLGSITLRESFQVLFFMLAVFFGLKMHQKGGINFYLVALGAAALVMGLLHKGLLIYSFFLVAVFMAYSPRAASVFGQVKKLHLLLVFAIPLAMALIVIAVNLNIQGLAVLRALANLDILEAASGYRDRPTITRATYGIKLDLSSTITGISSGVKLYLYYLFAPFPWQINNVLDIYASIESIARLVLTYFSLKSWRRAQGVQRRRIGLMLILFFSMTLLWAMGTTNYGTAIRHHMLTWWILVLVGLPVLLENLRRFRFRPYAVTPQVDSAGEQS